MSPDCLSMLLSVFGGMSLSGCFTVTRPFFSGCLYWWWLPVTSTSYHPSARSALITSLEDQLLTVLLSTVTV